ncbi:MAG: lipocalin family protein [Bacteriovoracaceae bacterium]
MKRYFLLLILLLSTSIFAEEYSKTVKEVSLDKFMKKWFVIAGRFTFMENGAHNAVEEYTFNKEKDRIDINFYFNKDSFDGRVRKIPQKAWIENKKSNAHWKVSPFWPLKFDYLVVALAPDYSWTAIGVPSQKYLWIMADRWDISDSELKKMIEAVQEAGYSVEEIERIPQSW